MHDHACPLSLSPKKWCSFGQKISEQNDESFSYVVLQRKSTSSNSDKGGRSFNSNSSSSGSKGDSLAVHYLKSMMSAEPVFLEKEEIEELPVSRGRGLAGLDR